MRFSGAIVLATLALSVVLAQGLVRVPLEAVQGSSELASTKRFLSEPLYRLSVGMAASINIGGKDYRLYVDTGVTDTYISAANCTISPASGPAVGCQYSTNFYDGDGPVMSYDSQQCSASITFEGVSDACQVSSTYLDATAIAGVARNDTLILGTYTVSTTFAAATTMVQDFMIPGMDGVWGLIRPNPSVRQLQNGPLGALFSAGLPKNFSLCLTTNTGELHLGGYDDSYAGSAISWLPLDLNSVQYAVQLSGVQFDSSTIAQSSAPAYFSSGMTFSYFPKPVYDSLVASIRAYCPSCPNVFGAAFVNANPDLFPSFTLTFVDATGASVPYTFAPRDWLMGRPSTSQYVAGFMSSDDEHYIIGASMMNHWYTIFDIHNGVLGLSTLQSGKCTAASAAPIAPLGTVPVAPIAPVAPVATPSAAPSSEGPSSPSSPSTPSSSPNASEPINTPADMVPSAPSAPSTPTTVEPTPSSASTLTLSIVYCIAALASLAILN